MFLQTAQELEISSIVQEALTPSLMLEKYPKCILEAYIMVLEADGGLCKKRNVINVIYVESLE